MHQCQLALVLLGEVLEGEGLQVGDVRALDHEAVAAGVPEGEVGGEEAFVAGGAEDGDRVGAGGEGGGGEEGLKALDEADARVVEEGHAVVETFFCFWGRAVLGLNDAEDGGMEGGGGTISRLEV